MKPRFIAIITACSVLALGGVLSYAEYMQNGSFTVGELFHPTLPEEELYSDTSDNQLYVPVRTEADTSTSSSTPSETSVDTIESVERTPVVEVNASAVIDEQSDEENSANTPVEQLFTKAGLVDIVIRQDFGKTQELFDLITVSTPLHRYDIDVLGGTVGVYIGPGSAQMMQEVLNNFRLLESPSVSVARLDQPYGDEFAYVNVANEGDTVRSVMLLGNQLIGYTYPRSFHQTFYTFLSAL